MTRSPQQPAAFKHKLRIAIFATLVFAFGVTFKGCNQTDEPPLFIIKSR